MVEDGAHLWNCIQYVDLNTVRAGIVSHPADHILCGYQEPVGDKTRYRRLDIDRALELLGMPGLKTFAEEYRLRIGQAIAVIRLDRETRWTASIAVGNKSFVQTVANVIRHERLRPRIKQVDDGSCSVW